MSLDPRVNGWDVLLRLLELVLVLSVMSLAAFTFHTYDDWVSVAFAIVAVRCHSQNF